MENLKKYQKYLVTTNTNITFKASYIGTEYFDGLKFYKLRICKTGDTFNFSARKIKKFQTCT